LPDSATAGRKEIQSGASVKTDELMRPAGSGKQVENVVGSKPAGQNQAGKTRGNDRLTANCIFSSAILRRPPGKPSAPTAQAALRISATSIVSAPQENRGV
jgi:hypothetical protein